MNRRQLSGSLGLAVAIHDRSARPRGSAGRWGIAEDERRQVVFLHATRSGRQRPDGEEVVDRVSRADVKLGSDEDDQAQAGNGRGDDQDIEHDEWLPGSW